MSKLQPYGRGRADSKREIQRLLDAKGKNFVDVAAAAGVTPQTVSATMNGFRHSRVCWTRSVFSGFLNAFCSTRAVRKARHRRLSWQSRKHIRLKTLCHY